MVREPSESYFSDLFFVPATWLDQLFAVRLDLGALASLREAVHFLTAIWVRFRRVPQIYPNIFEILKAKVPGLCWTFLGGADS